MDLFAGVSAKFGEAASLNHLEYIELLEDI
jgi:hypothetical protein